MNGIRLDTEAPKRAAGLGSLPGLYSSSNWWNRMSLSCMGGSPPKKCDDELSTNIDVVRNHMIQLSCSPRTWKNRSIQSESSSQVVRPVPRPIFDIWQFSGEVAVRDFQHKFQELHIDISNAVALQCHIIATLAARTDFGSYVPDEQSPFDPAGLIRLPTRPMCTCTPSTRVRGKASVCRNLYSCQGFQVWGLGRMESDFV